MRAGKPHRGIAYWLAVFGVLVATTPSENHLGAADVVLIGHFLGLALAIPYLINGKVSSPSSNTLIYFFCIFIALVVSNFGAPSYWAFSVTVLGMATMYLFSCSGLESRLLAVVDMVLWINLVGFVLQYLVLLATGDLLALHEWLFPYSESRAGQFLGFLRLSGFHLEPGTYASFLYLLVVIRLFLGGRLTDRISVLIFISSALTFSAWGIIAFLVGMIGIALSKFSEQAKILRALLSVFIGLAGLVVAAYLLNFESAILEYLLIRLDTTQGSASYRVIAFEELVRTFKDYVPLGLPMAEKFCEGCRSPQDLGLWSQMIVRLGLAASLLIFLLSLRSAWQRSLVVFILVAFAFSGKYDLTKPIVWMFFGIALLPQSLSGRRNPRWVRAGT